MAARQPSNLPDPRFVFSTGAAFDRAATVLLDIFDRDPDAGLGVVINVNAAFAAEVYLKCLHLLAGKRREGHKLDDLFDSLPDTDKSPIAAEFNQRSKRVFWTKISPGVPETYDVELEVFLPRIASTFVDWRYIHEATELADASGLIEFVDALRRQIERTKPEWIR